MKVKDAKKITGSMTRTKKMPGLSYSLPAWECITGAKLRKVKGSVCAGCYALKGNYTRYPAIKAAQYYRLATLMEPDWVPAMVTQIKRQKFFRWHDAGDIQSAKHLTNIFEVCNQTPATRHWLPTREARFLKLMDPDIVPANLVIRMSSHMIDQGPVKSWPWTSTVQSPGAMRSSHVQDSRQCPARDQGNQCKSCRSCWDRRVTNVTYPKH
jgi:hypothetical protein|tara:strand:+ start:37 stop:669 length:633 start_codon:yes stop_codon:yes gene_type:complete